MVIVHVLNSLVLGGTEKIVVDICNNIDPHKHDVYLITFTNDRNDIRSELNSNIKLIELPFKCNSIIGILTFWFTGLPKFVRLINSFSPDIVHSHLYYHYYLFLCLGLRLSKVSPSSIRTVHTSGLYYDSKSALNLFRLYTEKLGSMIYPESLISISKVIHEKNKRIFKGAKKIRLIPNGINLDKFNRSSIKTISKNDFNIEDNTIIVAYVSRLNPGKNHNCLFKAWSELIKVKSNINLCIVGDGILKETLIRQCEDLGILQKVTFTGSIENIAEFLSIVDIGIFPSQFEGFPISVIEKMAMEVPLITSNIEAFRDLIIDNENGLVCKVNDYNDYTEKLIKLIDDEELRLKIGKNGRKTVEKYDIKRITSDTISFYEETLSL